MERRKPGDFGMLIFFFGLRGTRPKGVPMNRSISRYFVIATLAFVVLFSGCDLANSPDYTGSLVGRWKASYGDGFEVSGTTYTQYDDADLNVSFAGTIMGSPDLTAETGYLYILITNPGSWGKTDGYYYAIHWENLSETGVSQGSASLVDFLDPKNSGMATLEEAIAEYTVDKGYFGYHGEYAKQ